MGAIASCGLDPSDFMTVHLKKLSVGSASVDGLRALQAQRLANVGRLIHITRNRPRRVEELLNGGSIYWIIKGVMTARQAIIDFVEAERADGSPACGIVLSPEIVTVAPTRMRIFKAGAILRLRMLQLILGLIMMKICQVNFSQNYGSLASFRDF